METTRRFWQKSFGYCSLIRLILVVGVLFWFTLFWGGFLGYQGSKFVYVIFSLFFLAMLASGFYRQVSYGYLFLVIFLWLGFWLKLTVHLIIDYPFGEPIGSFNGSAGSWDEVLQVAIVASLGVVMGRIIYGLTRRKSTMLISEGNCKVPAWYAPIRRWLWSFVMLVTLVLATLNVIYGIQQSGLVPRTILPWHLNASIYWMVGTGSAMGIATLLWWDISLKKNISLPIYAILAESFFSTVSLLSRGVYIFHAIPQLLALLKNRKVLVGISRNKSIIIAFVFVGLFIVSLSAVSVTRSYYYSNIPIRPNNIENFKMNRTFDYFSKFFFDSAKIISKTLNMSSRLIVDRWIGLEGVMAISSFEGKNNALFLNALNERPEIGKSTLYQDVCNSHYRLMDMSKYQFASLSGPVGFFYYTSSLIAVFFGMLTLVFGALFSEYLVYSLLGGNMVLCALYGMDVANCIAQLGVAPRQLLIHFFLVFCGIIFLYIIQSASLVKKLKNVCDSRSQLNSPLKKPYFTE